MKNEPALDTAKLENLHQKNGKTIAACPACREQGNDKKGEHLIITTEGRFGCVMNQGPEGEQHRRRIFELAGAPRRAATSTKSATRPRGEGYTLEKLRADKKLSREICEAFGLSEITYLGAPAVRFPYRGPDGLEAATRYRIAATGDRFKWKSGSKPFLYGLDKVKFTEPLVLVEGESDTLTLHLHKFNALGLPGASNWKEPRDAAAFSQAPEVYIIIEPDTGGETVLKWLATSAIRQKVKLIRLDGFKDASEMHLAGPEKFRERFESALAAAVPFSKIEAEQRRKEREEAAAACASLAKRENILDLVVREANALGLTGEDRNIKLIYLAITSRIFSRPVSIANKGPSSSGKSFTVEIALKFFPPEAFYALTAFSEHALAYGTEPLSNRFLIIFEANGLEGDMQTYLIRSLLSEGCIRYETVEKTSEGLVPRLIEREGPTGLIVTTTKTRLHPENETRLLSLATSDTREQTSAILAAIAEGHKKERNLDEFLALQKWIGTGPREVEVPFAVKLAGLVPPVAVRLRRDFTTLLALVKAHAALHQASRDTTPEGAIIATVEDYRAVRELVLDLFAQGLEATVPPSVRETVRAVADNEGEEGDEGASVMEIAAALKLDKASASRRLRAAADRGFIINLENRKGRPAKWRTDEPMPDDIEILPPPEALTDEETIEVEI